MLPFLRHGVHTYIPLAIFMFSFGVNTIVRGILQLQHMKISVNVCYRMIVHCPSLDQFVIQGCHSSADDMLLHVIKCHIVFTIYVCIIFWHTYACQNIMTSVIWFTHINSYPYKYYAICNCRAPAGSRGRAPGQGVRGRSTPEVESFLALGRATDRANLYPLQYFQQSITIR